ncbi:MAG: ROK family protein [Pseudomonadota bacterium]
MAMDTQTLPPTTAHRIGVDLGGTKTEVVVLAPLGDVAWRRRCPTPVDKGYTAILENIADLVRQAETRIPKGERTAVGIGIPGSIRPDTGSVQNANTTCLIGRPLQQDLETLLGRRVVVDNDANCFTLAESLAGAGRGYDLVFGVIMGTGCGGGLFINGRVRQGPHAIAGEWGHVVADPAGAPCYCGNRGCVETLISGGGVARRFCEETGRPLAMPAIVNGARCGDPDCRRAFDRFLDDFGRCLGGLISVLDPDAVVLGGGLSHIDELYGAGTENVRHYAFGKNLRTPILKNRLGDSAGVIGAAWIGC